MTTKKLEVGNGLQLLGIADAKALYSEKFQLRPYSEFLRKFEGIVYQGGAYGYNHKAIGIAITGSLIADTQINAALLAEKIPTKPYESRDAAYSLAIFLKTASISDDGRAEGKRLYTSSIFDDIERLSEGKKVRLNEPCPVDHEFSGEAIGATIKCLYKTPADKAEGSQAIEVIVNEPLLEEVAMVLRTQLHDQIITLRK